MRRLNLAFVAGLSLAAISLYFSASGLIHLFVGSSTMIAVMAIAFEGAKVAITMYLLRHFRWRLLPLALSAALVVLSAVSSIGIYGTLGRAYHTGRTGAVQSASQVDVLQQTLTALEQDRTRLYEQVEAVPASQGTNRRRMLIAVQPQIRVLDKEISQARASLAAARQTAVTEAQDVGDLRYASQLFGVSQDQLAMGIITVLAFLLDPLALMLLLASGVKGTAPVARPEEASVPTAAPVVESSEPPVQSTTLTLPQFRVPSPTVLRFDPPANGLSAGASTMLNIFRRRQPNSG